MQEALDLARTTNWYGLDETYRFLAEAYLLLGSITTAFETACQGLTLARTYQQVLEIGNNLRVIGTILPYLDHTPLELGATDIPPTPTACFAQALDILSGIGARGEQARTLYQWARYELHSGDAEQGAAHWAAARALFSQLGMHGELARMQTEHLREA